MILGSAASNRILVPSSGIRGGRTGGDLLWGRLVDDWKAHGLPVLTLEDCPPPPSFGDRPLPLAVWNWFRFGASRNCLVVADQSRSGRLGLLLRALRRRPAVRILLVVNHLNERFRYDNAVYTRLARANETAMLRMADRIIVHTGAVADAVRARGVDDSRLTLIRVGLHKVDRTLTVRDLAPDQPLKLLWVGGDFVRKGMKTLLLAMASLSAPRPRLTVVGRPYPASIQETIEGEVAAGGLEKDVAFLGQVPDEQLAALWYDHDVYLQPSLHEGHGSALDEALIRGMPCVASDLPVFRERLQEGDVCFFPVEDAESLARCLVRLRSRPLRDRLSTAARNRAATFPTWSDTLRNYETLVKAEFERVGGDSR